ncbi:MAG: hypothetical protein JWQ20_1048 [Conexibacter sp.]|nr:hypothetical protein [Conexibacter sp.]
MQPSARLIAYVLMSCCFGVIAPPAASAAVYLSPAGSDSASCSAAAPCRSFDRGYRAAPAGDEVVLAGGAYGGQALANLPVKASAAKVAFHPAAGAAVRLGYLRIDNSDNIEVRDVQTDGWGVQGGSAHVVLRNLSVFDRTDGGFFGGADDVQVIGGEIGRIDPDDGIHFNNAYGTNTNITIDGLFMHDLTRTKDPSSHDDCIQTGDVTNLVIRNSRFVNCGTQGVFLNPYNGGATKNITIENTWFGPAQLGYNSLYVGDAVGVTVRNNSFSDSLYVSPTSSGVSFVGNILGRVDGSTCSSAVSSSDVFDYNMSPSSCSGAKHHVTNSAVLSQFVNAGASAASAMDLHLKAGAMAIDRDTSGNYPANDYDGQGRPIGTAPDIGADEWGQGPPAPPGPGPGTTPGVPAPAGGTPAGGGGTTTGTPATASTPASAAVAGVLGTLPASTAASFRRVEDPKVGTKAPLRLAGVDDAQICRRTRKGCASSTRLRIAMTKATTLKLVFRRVRPGQRAKIVLVTRVRVRAGANVVRVRARGLRAGRYHLILRAPNGASVDVPLKVAAGATG